MNDRRQLVKWVSGLLLLVIVTNCPPFRWLVKFQMDNIYFTQDGGTVLEEMPGFGGHYEAVERGFEEHKRLFPNRHDTVLYRAFKMNPLAFWHWYDYLFHPRYKLPYRQYVPNPALRDSLQREAYRRTLPAR
ncbi:hypothetical protein [Spirosoma luteolum]